MDVFDDARAMIDLCEERNGVYRGAFESYVERSRAWADLWSGEFLEGVSEH